MKKLILLLLFISLVSCEQESPEQYWQKGNLHTHSFWSDGDDFPEMIIQWYKDNNYPHHWREAVRRFPCDLTEPQYAKESSHPQS